MKALKYDHTVLASFVSHTVKYNLKLLGSKNNLESKNLFCKCLHCVKVIGTSTNEIQVLKISIPLD